MSRQHIADHAIPADWLSIQSRSFKNFIQKESTSFRSFQRLIGKHQIFDLDDAHQLRIVDWQFMPPRQTPAECRLENQTYAGALLMTFAFSGPAVGDPPRQIQRCMLMLPVPTDNGEFVVHSKTRQVSSRYVFIMQLIRAPGVYFKTSKNKQPTQCDIVPSQGRPIKFTIRSTKKGTTVTLKYFVWQKAETGKRIHRWVEMSDTDESAYRLAVTHFSKLTETIDLALLGKRQVADQLGKPFQPSETTCLTHDEFIAIARKLDAGDVKDTDERCLKNRRVKCIGDFLYEKLDRIFKDFYQKIENNWQSVVVAKSGRSKKIKDMIRDQVFEHPFNRFFNPHPLLELVDKINPMAGISQKRRLTLLGPGGVPEQAKMWNMRDIHHSDFGRICPVETPQGTHLGLNLYLAKGARVNDLGLIEAPYVDVATGKIHYLDPYAEAEQVAAAAIGSASSGQDWVHARTPQDESAYLSGPSLTHCFAKPEDMLSVTTNLIPFVQHNDGNRALMGANMIKQALPLLKPQAPLIKSGLEDCLNGMFSAHAEVTNGGLCLGANLRVGYLPWDFTNYEDGIVISRRLQENDTLTHVRIAPPAVCTANDDIKQGLREIITSDNEYLTPSERAQLGSDGVIKQGAVVKKGDVLVSKLRLQTQPPKKSLNALFVSLLGKPAGCDASDASVRWNQDQHGEVQQVHKIFNALYSDKLARVIIEVKTVHRIQVGDKLTGRHGNKGVVAAILPEREMPYFKSADHGCQDPKCQVLGDHTHLEILLNPLTVPGRINLGQLYETTLGWIAAHTQPETGFTAAPFDAQFDWPKIQGLLADAGLTEKQGLYFWQDVQEIPIKRPVTVGYQYFLKLKHLAEDKLHMRARGVYSAMTEQPVKLGKKDSDRGSIKIDSGQRLGEMEVWALLGHQANAIVDEMLYLKSDDSQLRALLKNARLDNAKKVDSRLAASSRVSRPLQNFAWYCRVLGIAVECRNSRGKWVSVADLEDMKNGKPDALRIRLAEAREISSWNVPFIKTAADFVCQTNREYAQAAVHLPTCAGAGCIRLAVPVIHPLFFESLQHLLGKKANAHILDDACNRIDALYQLAKQIDLEAVAAGQSGAAAAQKRIQLAQTLLSHKVAPTDLFISHLIVPPVWLRLDRENKPIGNILAHDLNYVYKNILKKNEQLEKMIETDAPAQIIANERRLLQQWVTVLMLNQRLSGILHKPKTRRQSPKPLISILATIKGSQPKQGLFRSQLLGKRVDFSARAVIIPDPALGLDEVGLPTRMAKALYHDLLMQKCLKKIPAQIEQLDDAGKSMFIKLHPQVRSAKARHYLIDPANEPQIKTWLEELARHYPVLLNRQPSLHRLSILAFTPRFFDQDAIIRLNPWVCAPFNADFDGDQMAVYLPMTPLAQAEAQRMFPSHVLRSPAHGKLVISHKQDPALAMALLQGAPVDGATLLYDELDYWECKNPDTWADQLYQRGMDFRRLLTRSGITLGISDFMALQPVDDKLDELKAELRQDRNKLSDERWSGIRKEIEGRLTPIPQSPLDWLKQSGAVRVDLMQLAGMRGYMNRPGGGQTDVPVCGNLRDGLTPLDYFVACHGSRQGLSDKGLMTAVTGDLTNVLVQAIQDVTVVEQDCGSQDTVRTPVFCKSQNGICQKCLGLLPDTHALAPQHYPAGIIAAQSIGEPGTQLTLRTFHTGGAAERKKERSLQDAIDFLFYLKGIETGISCADDLYAWVKEALAFLQGAYGQKADVADIHFEVILRAMLQTLIVTRSRRGSVWKKDDRIHLQQYLALSDPLAVRPRSILQVASNSHGLLARLGFRNLRQYLIRAALQHEQDDLADIKAKIITGTIYPSKGEQS